MPIVELRHLKISGRLIDPVPVEAAIRTYPGVVDAAVTAIGNSRERRLVAYIVLRSGLDRVDLEGPLEAYLKERCALKIWQRPRAYSQVRKVPRHEDGTIRRTGLSRAFGDGRRFMFKTVRWDPGRKWPVTATIARPVNVVKFEGVVSTPPRRKKDLRAVRLTVSHREPGGKPKYVTFFFRQGTLARRAQALVTGQRVIVVGEMGHRRVLWAVDFAKVGDGPVAQDQPAARESKMVNDDLATLLVGVQ